MLRSWSIVRHSGRVLLYLNWGLTSILMGAGAHPFVIDPFLYWIWTFALATCTCSNVQQLVPAGVQHQWLNNSESPIDHESWSQTGWVLTPWVWHFLSFFQAFLYVMTICYQDPKYLLFSGELVWTLLFDYVVVSRLLNAFCRCFEDIKSVGRLSNVS